MRIALALAFLVVGCGPADPPALQTNGAAAPPAGEPDNRIECRTGSVAAFERTCSVEIAQGPGGVVFTLRKADGGFRRLLQTVDGFAAADGAEPAHVTRLRDGRVEIEIGGDHFRFGTEWRVTLPAELRRP